MACPYFMPVERLENGSWPHPSRLPLGGGWRGHCTASGHEGEIPSQDILEEFCNLGYASGCVWAPRERTWDAVRFAVAPPADSGERGKEGISRSAALASTLRLRFACERNHRPVAHGELEFDVPRATWLRRHDDARIQKMAECFLDSYLQKKA
jgi:hypothetical protein